jgi:hypothetical protein
METMTRERMRALQAVSRHPRKLYRVSRDGAKKVALAAGRAAVAGGADPMTGWWPDLARLTRHEMKEVREHLAGEKAG